MIPVPTVLQLSQFSGRPEDSYTGYAESALIQASIEFTIVTEISADDWPALAADDQTLATQGILARSDWYYLRQPYQQAVASPMQGETIGSYSYSKPPPVEMRNVQAQELGVTLTGIPMWDLAVQYLAKRTRAAGVFFGQMRAFDLGHRDRYGVTMIRRDINTGQLELIGPAEMDRLDVPSIGVPAINAEVFPSDPGVG